MQKIIAFSREFGSGGHEIAERIAKACNLAFYDRNLLDEIAKEKLGLVYPNEIIFKTNE